MDSALALHTKSFLMISTQLPTGPLPCDNCRSTLDLFSPHVDRAHSAGSPNLAGVETKIITIKVERKRLL